MKFLLIEYCQLSQLNERICEDGKRRAHFAQDIFSKMTKTTQATCQNCYNRQSGCLCWRPSRRLGRWLHPWDMTLRLAAQSRDGMDSWKTMWQCAIKVDWWTRRLCGTLENVAFWAFPHWNAGMPLSKAPAGRCQYQDSGGSEQGPLYGTWSIWHRFDRKQIGQVRL